MKVPFPQVALFQLVPSNGQADNYSAARQHAADKLADYVLTDRQNSVNPLTYILHMPHYTIFTNSSVYPLAVENKLYP